MADISQNTSEKKKKTIAGFHKYFLDKIKPKLKNLETRRKHYLIEIAVIEFLILLGILFCVQTGPGSLRMYVTLLAFIPGVAYALSKVYKDEVKGKILPLILLYLGDFKVGDKNVDMDELKRFYYKSNLFPNFDEIEIDDFIQGKYKNIDVNIYEIKLCKLIKDYGRKERNEYKTQFGGICFRFKHYNKQKTQTVVLKRLNKPSLGNLQRVKLEDPEFENYFDVYSNDQITSRTTLTPAYMNRLVDLVKHKSTIALNLSMSFTDDDICISIKSDKDWFEVPILKPIDDFSNYREILKDLNDILSIIDTLKYTDD